MAEKIIRVDDLDGSEGEDITKRDFEVAGTTYTIDLSEANHKRLAELVEELTPFIESANEVKAATRSRKPADKAVRLTAGHTNSNVRTWAKAEGMDINDRGKIADEVYDKYYEAHPDAKPE